MIPRPFAYHAPTSVAEALSLLGEYGDEAKLLAGGHSLLPTMKLRLAAPSVLIDLNQIAALRGVTLNGSITIGSMTTWAAIGQHAGLRQALPVLSATVQLIGDLQVRNRGTLGGALAHADPAADAPALTLALAATMHVHGRQGTRTIAAADFFTDMLTTALAPDEILTAISFPPMGAGEGAAYLKLPHPASRYAVVGVAAYLKLDGPQVRVCRIAVTGAGTKAERQPQAEQALCGGPGDAESIAAASALAGEGMDILGDLYASELYRRAMVKLYTKRALSAALAEAQG
ncbi:MAG: xanthine dehydrogenase family protein subunit M [Chloroflexales bacterium]